MQHTHRISKRLVISVCSVLILALWGCSESPIGVDAGTTTTSKTSGSPEIMPTAGSNIITVSVRATVVSVSDPGADLGGAVSVGDAVNGFYVFDQTVADTNVDPKIGLYPFLSMPNRMSFALSGLTFASDPAATAPDLRYP